MDGKVINVRGWWQKQNKADNSVCFSDSYCRMHHKLMPGCHVQLSEHKEHLSVTFTISALWELGPRRPLGSARSCRQLCGPNGWKVFLSSTWMSCVWFGMSARLFSADSFRKELITFTLWCTSTEQKLFWCQRRLTNVSQRGKSAGSRNLMEHYLPRTVCFLRLAGDVEHLFFSVVGTRGIWSRFDVIIGPKKKPFSSFTLDNSFASDIHQ